MDDDAHSSSEPEAVKQIVAEMVDDGFMPAILVFVAQDGTTRLWHREDLDAEDLMHFLLATGVAREVRH